MKLFFAAAVIFLFLTGCGLMEDKIKRIEAKDSPDGKFTATLFYLKSEDPFFEQLVVTLTSSSEEATPWRENVAVFPVEYSDIEIVWIDETKLEVKYIRKREKVIEHNTPKHGVHIMLTKKE